MIKYYSGGDGIPAWVNDHQTGIVLPAKVILFIREYAAGVFVYRCNKSR